MGVRMPLPAPFLPPPDPHRKATRRLEWAERERDAARFFASDDFDGERGENHEAVAANWIEQAESDFADAKAVVAEFEDVRCPNEFCDDPTNEGKSGVDGPRVCTSEWHQEH